MSAPNPFAVLDLEPGFDLDEKRLHQKFIAASAATHPDRFSDPVQQAEAAERAAIINEAYRLLTDPESRANVLLELLGGPSKEQDKSLPPELLADMMELRERLEEATDANDRPTLIRLRDYAHGRRAEHLARIAEAFRRGAPMSADQLAAIRRELNALRYYERMIEQLPH